MAVLGSAALLEVEINAGLEVFKLLEPEVQKGLIGLIHLLHRRQSEVKTPQNEAALSSPAAAGTATSDSREARHAQQRAE